MVRMSRRMSQALVNDFNRQLRGRMWRGALDTPVGAAGLAYEVGRRAFQAGRAVLGKRKYWNPKTHPSYKKFKTKSSVLLDGTTIGKVRVPQKKKKVSRKKKTLTQRVKNLEKDQPCDSTKLTRYVKHFKLPPTSSVNAVHLWEISMTDQLLWETTGALNSMGGSSATDFTAENTCIKVKNLFMRGRFTNSTTTNCEIRYMFVRCIDDTDNFYTEDYIAEAADRGLGSLSAVAEAAETATASAQPRKIILSGTQRDFDFTLGLKGKSKNYALCGSVNRIIVGPGDTVNVVQTVKSFDYKPEAYDQSGTTFCRGHYDYHLIVLVKGTLSHDATNHSKVGYSNPAFNVECVTRWIYEYSDGKGLKEYNTQNTLVNTGFTVPNHVDDKASAVEGDNQ